MATTTNDLTRDLLTLPARAHYAAVTGDLRAIEPPEPTTHPRSPAYDDRKERAREADINAIYADPDHFIGCIAADEDAAQLAAKVALTAARHQPIDCELLARFMTAADVAVERAVDTALT